MREHFASLLDDASRNRVRFYSTTDLVAAQYNRLGVADFGLLPYPVSPSFRPVVGCDSQQRPLRVVCAGNAREEQGPHHLEQIVRDLWADQLTTGRMQLLVQAGPHLRLPFPPGASEAHLDPTTQAPLLSPAPIVRVSHPLTPERYVDLIRSADIGLFLYDSYRYFTRCSGILVEMLCSGVPVIVPAGCWLAEEIAESIYRHLDQLTEHLPTVARMAVPVPRQAGFPDPVTRLTASVEAVTCGRGPAGLMSEVCVPAGATEVLASFRWLRRQDTGHYLRLECEQLDRRGHLLGCAATIVGQRATQAAVPALFHLGSGVERIRLCWENAYLDARVAIGDMNLRFLSAAESGGSCPSGSAGLIAADPQQIPRLLREMAIHHAHYRQSARQFSQGYGRLHDPRNTLQLLVAEVRRVAAA
jgi:hypothetical protein